jgi:hypothetical protein
MVGCFLDHKEVIMKLISMALSIACVLSIAAQAGELTDKTDRFRGTRLVSWQSYTDSGRTYSYNVYAHYSNVADKEPYGYYAVLVPPFGSEPFGSCNHNTWLVDDKRAPELEMAYVNSDGPESFRVNLQRSDLERLAAAEKVEFKICTTEGAITKGDLEGMRKVLAATK